MKITELSRISGVNAATIRSYRLKGFLHPVKEKNGYYDYTAEDLVSLAYLRKLRGFSMSLEDIDTLFEASDPGRMLSLLDRESCRIQAKIHELEEQLRFLDFEKQHLTESMQKDGDSVREFQAIDDKLDFYEKDILSENLPPAFYRMATPSLLVAKEVLNGPLEDRTVPIRAGVGTYQYLLEEMHIPAPEHCSLVPGGMCIGQLVSLRSLDTIRVRQLFPMMRYARQHGRIFISCTTGYLVGIRRMDDVREYCFRIRACVVPGDTF